MARKPRHVNTTLTIQSPSGGIHNDIRKDVALKFVAERGWAVVDSYCTSCDQINGKHDTYCPGAVFAHYNVIIEN